MVGPYRRLAAIALLALGAASSACRGTPQATLSDIPGIEALREQFNADAGKPRVVLLLSPT
jgi:hypothetical protein